jgi:hypothetical protein
MKTKDKIVFAVFAVSLVLMLITVTINSNDAKAREAILSADSARTASVEALRAGRRVNALLVAQNLRKDSTLAADSAKWRSERASIVSQGRARDARANATASDLRAELDLAQAVQLDSLLAGKDARIDGLAIALASADRHIAVLDSAYSGAQALIAGLTSELNLALMTIRFDSVAIQVRDDLIFRLENPSAIKRFTDGLPKFGGGVVVAIGVGFVLTR